jgi:tetratricopeptide (TPR) repeat protein
LERRETRHAARIDPPVRPIGEGLQRMQGVPVFLRLPPFATISVVRRNPEPMFSTRAFGVDDILAVATMDYHAGRFADAQRGCRTALKLLPDDANALYLLGLTEVGLGSVEAGVARIEGVIAQDPTRADRACGLADVLKRLQRLDEAVRVLGRAVMRVPDNADAFRRLVEATRAQAERPEPCAPAAVAAAPDDSRSISVVVCSIDERKARQIREHYSTLLAGRKFEIVQIDDARSLAEGYNRGFAKTSGEIVIFSHDDIEIASPDFSARLLRHLSSNDVVGVAGTSFLNGANWNSAGWPRVHGCVAHRQHDGNGFIFHCFGPPPSAAVEALDGLFIAAKRRVCEAIPFDAATFDGFHLYDLDFTYRAFLAGFRITVPWDILIIHASAGRLDAQWQKYAQKFVDKYRGQKIVLATPPAVSWPFALFLDRAQMTTFHRAMAAAQGVDV